MDIYLGESWALPSLLYKPILTCIEIKRHIQSYRDGYYKGWISTPCRNDSKLFAPACYFYNVWTLLHGPLYDAIKLQKTWYRFILLLVLRTACLALPETFCSSISCRKVNVLLRKVHLCVSSRQSKDIHALMIYTVYKSWHTVSYLLAKWLHYIHHSYLKCLWNSVSQQAFIECLKKAFHINWCVFSQ